MLRPSTRRRFLLQSAASLWLLGGHSGKPGLAQSGATDEVYDSTIGELQAAMTAGRVSAVQLVERYLNRIRAYDQAGPRLNAVLYVNPDATAQARALDTERRRRGPRGPLHGVPVLIKDNFDTRDMPTTGGCLALSGVVPSQDAFQIGKLRRAGAVILGKVNLHELALGLTTVSSLGGQTLNPYDVNRTPGGSSGGSAVAVAAGFAAFAMGTDTSGSIRIPSSHNSIVGLRPSAGLSSRSGIIPFGHTQDTGGPMARSVADIAIILDATVGYDPADPTTGMGKGRTPLTYTSALKSDALKGARIGVLGELFGNAPEDEPVAIVIRRAIEEMKTGGATAVDVGVSGLAAQLTASNLLSQELKFYLRDYLRRSRGARIKSVEELLASGLHTAQFQAFLEGANAMPDAYLGGDDHRMRLAARETLGRAILDVMDGNRLDALAYPTVRRIAPLVGGNQAGSNAGLSAQTGFPAITVPAGFTPTGFPVGIELLGRPFAEPTLIGLTYAYERATRHRRAPATTPSLMETSGRSAPVATPSTGDVGGVTFAVTATGAQSVPRSKVPFEAIVHFAFDAQKRQLGYTIAISGTSQEVAGVYLHRRANRPNGGVAHILTKSLRSQDSGKVTLTEPEVIDLQAGKFYVSVISTKDPLRSARGNLTPP